MIKLAEVTEENWMDVASLNVKDCQKGFLAPATGILARGYVYRDANAKVFVIMNDDTVVGVALVRDFTEEPLGYDLQQFMIDERFQGKGFGTSALSQILDRLRKERRFSQVEVCVNKKDSPALRMYKKLGFTESGYVNDEFPDFINLILKL